MKQPFLIRQTIKGVAAPFTDRLFPFLKPGQLLQVKFIAVNYDDTTAHTPQFRIVSPSGETSFYQVTTTTTIFVASLLTDLLIGEEECIGIYHPSLPTTVTCKAVLSGWLCDDRPEVVTVIQTPPVGQANAQNPT